MPLTMSKTSRLPAHSEQELVAALRAGDDRAFEELYSQYRERIFAFILSKVHDHGRAEDIAQEVFMSALRRLRSADQSIAFKPWL
jgi:DNA-directed RNA polymerase specialized sigma24 family protein